MENKENEYIHVLEVKTIKILIDPEIFAAIRKKLIENGRKNQVKLIKIIVGVDLITKINCITWNIRNSINGEEESFIFGIDSSNALRLNLDITITKLYNISCSYIDDEKIFRTDDARPIDKIIDLINNLN